MIKLWTTLPDLIAHVSRVAFLLPAIILFAIPILAEADTGKYRAFEAGILYSFPFKQAGAEVRYIRNINHRNHVFDFGMRYQKLNPYDRTNRAYRFGWGLRYDLAERDKPERWWNLYAGGGLNLKFLKDLEPPLIDNSRGWWNLNTDWNPWRWGGGVTFSSGIQIRFNERWLTDLSVIANSGFLTIYPGDFLRAGSPIYAYFTVLPRIGVVYELNY